MQPEQLGAVVHAVLPPLDALPPDALPPDALLPPTPPLLWLPEEPPLEAPPLSPLGKLPSESPHAASELTANTNPNPHQRNIGAV